jgi:hypothetical protein
MRFSSKDTGNGLWVTVYGRWEIMDSGCDTGSSLMGLRMKDPDKRAHPQVPGTGWKAERSMRYGPLEAGYPSAKRIIGQQNGLGAAEERGRLKKARLFFQQPLIFKGLFQEFFFEGKQGKQNGALIRDYHILFQSNRLFQSRLATVGLNGHIHILFIFGGII